MKTPRYFFHLVFSLMMLGTFSINSCDNDDEETVTPDEVIEMQMATLSGAQEVPAVNSPGTGTIAGSYNKTTNVLSYVLTYNRLSSATVMAHFHKGAVGASGPIEITISPSTFSSPFTGQATLTDAQETDLLAGLYYVNVHTTNFQAGEIRAQVRFSTTPATTGTTASSTTTTTTGSGATTGTTY